MINKIYKIIHNRYSVLFKFLFFLRYLLGIFFISAVLFLCIPYFFNFTEKDKVIKNYLLKEHDLTLSNYKNIKYNSFPTPNLEIQNANFKIGESLIKINTTNLNIYCNLLNIYTYENFKANKIIFKKSKVSLSDSDLKFFIDYIFDFKNKFDIQNLDLQINKDNKSLVNLKEIFFSNYGYNKDILKGELFGKKFKISTSDDNNKINFELLKTGIRGDIHLIESRNKLEKLGVFKSKLLNSNLKFDFIYDTTKLKIYNSYFRNKDLSFSNESTINLSPFFFMTTVLNIDTFNTKLFNNINIDKIFSLKHFIKKINTKNEFNFKSKKFNNNLVDDLYLNLSSAHGKLIFSKKTLISQNIFLCEGEVNLLEDYPILYFDCSITSKNKKKLLKVFSVNYQNKDEVFKLIVKGNVNILNNKINFKNIKVNQDYEAAKEDLSYFKQSFENILFDEDFLSIFNLKKIKKFISEIS